MERLKTRAAFGIILMMGSVTADEQGIRLRLEGDAAPMTMAWSEICAVVASKLDCIEYEELMIELEHENGDFLSFAASTAGFDAAADTMARCLSELGADWLTRAREASSEQEPIVLWRRRPET